MTKEFFKSIKKFFINFSSDQNPQKHSVEHIHNLKIVTHKSELRDWAADTYIVRTDEMNDPFFFYSSRVFHVSIQIRAPTNGTGSSDSGQSPSDRSTLAISYVDVVSSVKGIKASWNLHQTRRQLSWFHTTIFFSFMRREPFLRDRWLAWLNFSNLISIFFFFIMTIISEIKAIFLWN